MTALQLVDKQTGEILDAETAFDAFWTIYPRRVAKLDARKAWARIPASRYVPILEAVVAWRRIWAQKDLDYIAYPASWLRGERWEDELPVDPTVSCSAHVAADIPEQTARTTMPDNVRALLAKLRGK